MNPLQAILVFAVIPLSFSAVVALIVLGPGWTRAGRYRPGDDWDHDPVLINPSLTGDVTRALSATAIGEDARMGDFVPAVEVFDLSGEQRPFQGGASARW